MLLLAEKRLAVRRSANLEATLTFGRNQISGVIRNVSEGGAKIEVAAVKGIPDFFDLHVPGHRPQQCRVAWRSLKELGVQFAHQIAKR